MADLDKIVRPFQLFPRGSALAEKVLGARKPGVPVVLRIGASGSGKPVNGTVSISINNYKGAAVVEKPKNFEQRPPGQTPPEPGTRAKALIPPSIPLSRWKK